MPRNRQQSRRKILNAARRILEEEGFGGLGANALAARAGVGKPLIYRYFGNLDGVVQALAEEGGYRPRRPAMSLEGVLHDLIDYGRTLGANRLGRDLLAWQAAATDAPEPARTQSAARRPPGEETDIEALYALLTAATTFLLMWRDRHQEWAGVPLETAADMARLETVMARIVRALAVSRNQKLPLGN